MIKIYIACAYNNSSVCESTVSAIETKVTHFYWSDFCMILKNGFGKWSLFVLSANGWKDLIMDSSFSRQRKP